MTFIRKLLGLPEKHDKIPKCFTRINTVIGASTFENHRFDIDRELGVGTCVRCGLEIVYTVETLDVIKRKNDAHGMAIIRR